MKLLVPVDGSKYAMEAVKTAANLARIEGTEICLLAVNPFVADLDLGLTASERDVLSEKMRAGCEDALRKAEAILAERGIKPKAKTISSSVSVADEICSIAKDEAFDVIVMGSRGLTGVKRFLLGGITDKVVDHAPCSVFVVKTHME